MPHSLNAAILVEAGRRTSDWLLASLGVSAATVSASFAIYMVAVGPGTMPARGSGDFGVFARYDRRPKLVAAVGDAVPAAAQATPPLPNATEAFAPGSSDVDFTPVGSIASHPQADRQEASALAGIPAATAKPQPARLQDFAIRDVFDGKAVVESRNRLHLVEPGSVLEDIGRVLAVRQESGGWVVETEAGVIGR